MNGAVSYDEWSREKPPCVKTSARGQRGKRGVNVMEVFAQPDLYLLSHSAVGCRRRAEAREAVTQSGGFRETPAELYWLVRSAFHNNLTNQ